MHTTKELCIGANDPTDMQEPVDLLSRGEFVDQLISVVEILSQNRKSACYALDGEWGVGKTFVLNIFEKQLSSYDRQNPFWGKYLVFHYNCWQYDYYEEPLIAIIATIVDQIDKQINVLSSKDLEIIKATLKAVGVSILGKAHDLFKEKTGIDLHEIIDMFKNLKTTSINRIKQTKQFDKYFDLKENLQKLSTTLGYLTKEQTVIFIVDELDRCLPEYTIKVLERLHHVFYNIPNFQVVLAVDKQQLENTIAQIFGANVSVKRYLDKFIDFELSLTVGEVSCNIKDVYAQYFQSFTYDETPVSVVEDVCITILKGVEIRVSKAIIEKSALCHRLLNDEATNPDASVLCVELFLTLLKEYGLKVSGAKATFNSERLFTSAQVFTETDRTLTGLAVLSGRYRAKPGIDRYYVEEDNRKRVYINVRDIWGLLLGCYRIILGFTQDIWTDGPYTKMVVGNTLFQEYVLKYWKLIKVVN